MDSNESRARALLGDLSAGCSAVAWETADGGHLWGRNFDFNRIAADSGKIGILCSWHIVFFFQQWYSVIV